eukprot:gnl/Spiro4/2745_TR1333_c2_g1_i1.p1 gnl/Spiro4/2745_TR1333_c2_g1~~gnl/Spiro4/2745_TR1333_c2_g1_i1.p1  ORF type:complete len:671 (+),score=86.45 gnl/Spiro4/2745_TR1333_c2_g1_i1:102-2114(+)
MTSFAPKSAAELRTNKSLTFQDAKFIALNLTDEEIYAKFHATRERVEEAALQLQSVCRGQLSRQLKFCRVVLCVFCGRYCMPSEMPHHQGPCADKRAHDIAVMGDLAQWKTSPPRLPFQPRLPVPGPSAPLEDIKTFNDQAELCFNASLATCPNDNCGRKFYDIPFMQAHRVRCDRTPAAERDGPLARENAQHPAAPTHATHTHPADERDPHFLGNLKQASSYQPTINEHRKSPLAFRTRRLNEWDEAIRQRNQNITRALLVKDYHSGAVADSDLRPLSASLAQHHYQQQQQQQQHRFPSPPPTSAAAPHHHDDRLTHSTDPHQGGARSNNNNNIGSITSSNRAVSPTRESRSNISPAAMTQSQQLAAYALAQRLQKQQAMEHSSWGHHVVTEEWAHLHDPHFRPHNIRPQSALESNRSVSPSSSSQFPNRGGVATHLWENGRPRPQTASSRRSRSTSPTRRTSGNEPGYLLHTVASARLHIAAPHDPITPGPGGYDAHPPSSFGVTKPHLKHTKTSAAIPTSIRPIHKPVVETPGSGHYDTREIDSSFTKAATVRAPHIAYRPTSPSRTAPFSNRAMSPTLSSRAHVCSPGSTVATSLARTSGQLWMTHEQRRARSMSPPKTQIHRYKSGAGTRVLPALRPLNFGKRQSFLEFDGHNRKPHRLFREDIA